MRSRVALLALAAGLLAPAACGPIQPDQINSGGCETDADCGGGGLLCSRFGTCETELATITVTWTIDGAPASTASCQNIDHLQVDYLVGGSPIGGFSPVPCSVGKVHFDRLPPSIMTARLSELDVTNADHGQASAPVTGPLQAETAAITLPIPF